MAHPDPDRTTTPSMGEIPLAIHNHPLPLPASSGGGGGVVAATDGEVRRRRRLLVAVASRRDDGDDRRRGAIAAVTVKLAESPPAAAAAAIATVAGDAEDSHLRGLTSVHRSKRDGRLVFTSGVPGRPGMIRIAATAGGGAAGGEDDGANGRGTSLDVDVSSLLSDVTGGSSAPPLFDRPVGTAAFVVEATDRAPAVGGGVGLDDGDDDVDDAGRSPSLLLVLRMVDARGSVLSLSLSYPQMAPIPGGSFILPLSPPRDGGGGRRSSPRPHPGSSVECNQACFPTSSAVVFAMNPHLYCVDLGHGGSGGVGGITRVWTCANNVTSDPVADERRRAVNDDDDDDDASSSAAVTPAPKRLRESMGTILTMATRKLMGIRDCDPDMKWEYDDDDDEDDEDEEDDGDGGGWGGYVTAKSGGGGGGVVPPIAALTGLSSSTGDDDDDDDRVARVATLHSDGTLRVWTADPSSRGGSPAGGGGTRRLRVPSVQRVAVRRTSATPGGGVRYADPPVPDPSTWDPRRRDALTLRGTASLDPIGGTCEYEIALCVRCYSHPKRNAEEDRGSVYIFRGAVVVGADGGTEDATRVLPSGDTARMQTLALPGGTASVVDVSWSPDRDLVVLLRQRADGGDGVPSRAYYDIGDEVDGGRVILALYPLEGSSYSSQPLLPSNMTLPYLGFNHFGYTTCPSLEEELDRYICHLKDESGNIADEEKGMEADAGLSVANTAATNTSTANISQAQAQVDRAGLLAILQPFGRTRPSALAVYRAMSILNLLDDDFSSDEIHPLTILSAMRKWNKRSAFESSTFFSTSSALVLADNMDIETNGRNSSIASNSISIYQAFASATKTSKARKTLMDDAMDADGETKVIKSGAKNVEAARESHRLKWIRLLSEIRRQEAQLDEILCLTMSANNNFLFRGNMISVVALDFDAAVAAAPAIEALPGQDREIMAGLDELAIELFTCISSNPDLRQQLSKVESTLYDGVSKASSFVRGWADKGFVELLSHLAELGCSAMMRYPITDAQIQLLSELSQLSSNATETWLIPNLSASSPVCTCLAMSNISAIDSNQRHSCESEALSPTTALISARIESIRRLSLSRLVLVFGSPQKNPLTIQHGALRSTLYCTALSWSVNQISSIDKSLTVLEQDISQKLNRDFCLSGLAGALKLADIFVSDAFGNMFRGSLIFDKVESRVALRLLAPLVEFRSPLVSSEAGQKMRELASNCLLLEAAAFAKLPESSGRETSLVSLWRLASKSLLHITATTLEPSHVISNLMNRVGTLERHLDTMGGYTTALPLCCGVILDAIRDAISAISCHSSSGMSMETTASVPALWDIAFQTSMRGRLWDNALQSCIANPSVAGRRANFKRLILAMVDAGALGKIIDMSLTVVGLDLPVSMRMDPQEGVTDGTVTGVDLFDLAAEIIEETAVEQATFSLSSEVGPSDGRVLKDHPNYWSCLYALHASRGHWRQAANAMDMFGKATADSVSSSKSNSQKPIVLSKAASRKVMDDASLSSQACVHAISLIDKSHRYLLPGNNNIPTESRLLTEEDLERRAVRALALRMFSMDEYSPDSVGNILETASRDTIDSLARLGYYDQAISVALGVSSKRKGLPGGVDLFDDALKYILCTYLVPAATKSNATNVGDCGLELLQSRSKIAQIHRSSSACALGSAGNTPVSQFRVTSIGANVMSWVSNCHSEHILQSTMAMNLLQQYTTVHSKRCPGLGLKVAKSILAVEDGVSELPMWLKELCIFGIPGDDESKGGLFAKAAGKGYAGFPDPAGLMRLYIKHHQYGEACDVVTTLLSKQRALHSYRLPEKGSIDYVPYDLIDMLWNVIESIIASNSSTPSEDLRAQVQLLLKKRKCMEQALESHFESLKTSEEGLISARRLSRA